VMKQEDGGGSQTLGEDDRCRGIGGSRKSQNPYFL